MPSWPAVQVYTDSTALALLISTSHLSPGLEVFQIVIKLRLYLAMDSYGQGQDGKIEADFGQTDLDTALHEANSEGQRYNPAFDRRDMRRLGRVQEVKRRFRFFVRCVDRAVKSGHKH
jgi:hypothetical protein